MKVSNWASALGETIGKLIEDEIERTLKPVCTAKGYYYDRGGPRPGIRSGKKLQMVNHSGNTYQLDAVIENPERWPVVLLESKYLRYKKHNRDKASWTCASHYSLRKTHPTVRKSIAVLSGNWSKPSKAFMESFGIELYEVPFESMCQVLGEYGIMFDWDEKDSKTPRGSFRRYLKLKKQEKLEIGVRLMHPIRDSLLQSVRTTLEGGEDWAKRLSAVELLLKTDRNEYFTYMFPSARDATEFLLKLQIDAPDMSGKL